MKYAALIALILLTGCSDKTCSEIKSSAPVTLWTDTGDGSGRAKTIFPTECVK